MSAQAQNPNRLLPYDIDVEQALLGAVIRDNTAFYRLEGLLAHEDFYDPLHARIFEMIGDRLQRRMAVTPLTLYSSMKSDPGVIETGGQGYFDALMAAAPAIPPVKDYQRLLCDLSARRRLIHIGEDLVLAAYEPITPDKESSAEAIANTAAEAIYEISRKSDVGRGAVKMTDLMSEAIDKAEHAAANPAEVCLTSGLKHVDLELGGIYRGDVTILAGAPNMGKSAFAQMACMANALGQRYGETREDLTRIDADRPKQRVLFFSLEMADWQLGAREIAERSNVPSNLMRRGKATEFDIKTMRQRLEEMGVSRMWVDGGRKLSVQQIRARAHAAKRYAEAAGEDLALIGIDHLRFVRPANWKLDEKDQIQQVTSDLKDLAVELNVGLLLLSHLNREYNKRHSKRPINSDLYGASAIEQNADAIWFLHSEHYFLEREEPPGSKAEERAKWQVLKDAEEGWMEVFSTKARMDKVGKARVRWEPAFTRFSDPDFIRPTRLEPTLFERASDPLDDLDNRSPPVGA